MDFHLSTEVIITAMSLAAFMSLIKTGLHIHERLTRRTKRGRLIDVDEMGTPTSFRDQD